MLAVLGHRRGLSAEAILRQNLEWKRVLSEGKTPDFRKEVFQWRTSMRFGQPGFSTADRPPSCPPALQPVQYVPPHRCSPLSRGAESGQGVSKWPLLDSLP